MRASQGHTRITSYRSPAVVFILLLAVLSVFSCGRNGENVNGSKYATIQNLWSAVPLCDGATKVEESWKSQASHAYISKTFTCSNFSAHNLEESYKKNLTAQGWQFLSEKRATRWFRETDGAELRFRKGDYVLTFEDAGDDSRMSWHYGITISWDPV
jgi:hypothetical protein